jgi:hypothetical protein
MDEAEVLGLGVEQPDGDGAVSECTHGAMISRDGLPVDGPNGGVSVPADETGCLRDGMASPDVAVNASGKCVAPAVGSGRLQRRGGRPFR